MKHLKTISTTSAPVSASNLLAIGQKVSIGVDILGGALTAAIVAQEFSDFRKGVDTFDNN